MGCVPVVKRQLVILLVAVLGVVASGCSSGEQSVTKDQEEAFRNPPKEIPPEAAAAMAKAREEGMRRAQQAQSGNR